VVTKGTPYPRRKVVGECSKDHCGKSGGVQSPMTFSAMLGNVAGVKERTKTGEKRQGKVGTCGNRLEGREGAGHSRRVRISQGGDRPAPTKKDKKRCKEIQREKRMDENVNLGAT